MSYMSQTQRLGPSSASVHDVSSPLDLFSISTVSEVTFKWIHISLPPSRQSLSCITQDFQVFSAPLSWKQPCWLKKIRPTAKIGVYSLWCGLRLPAFTPARTRVRGHTNFFWLCVFFFTKKIKRHPSSNLEERSDVEERRQIGRLKCDRIERPFSILCIESGT